MKTEMKAETPAKGRIKHSRTGKLSIVLCGFAILIILSNLVSNGSLYRALDSIGPSFRYIAGIGALALFIASFILSVLDIRSKNRARLLSGISMAVSGLVIGLFVFVLAIDLLLGD